MKLKKKIINNQFLDGYRITYLFGNRDDIKKYISKEIGEIETIGEEFDGMHYYQGHHSLVCIFDNKKKIRTDVIIHEITHAVQKMLYFLNIQGDYSNTELVANLMMYYISEGLNFYNKK